MLPEISARRSLLWVKVQIPVVTGRQWGRDKSAPRPHETDPFHPLNSIPIYKQFLYIQHRVLVISSMWCILVSFYTAHLTIAHALLKKHSFQGSELLFKSLFRAVVQVIFHTICGANLTHYAFTHAHLLSKRNSPLSRVVLLNFIHLHLSNYLLSCLIPSFKLYRYMNTPIVADPQRKNELGRTIRNSAESQKLKKHYAKG